MHCAGVLLTGGASTRFGSPKALARLVPDGPTLAERAGAELRAVTDPVIEVGLGVSGLPAISDPRHGPLIAFAAGLMQVGTPAILLACDLPLVTAELLRWLANHPVAGTVIPVTDRPQPLCARWDAPLTERIAGLVEGGERSFRPLLDAAYLAPPSEWAAAGGPAGHAALDDADTPADLRRLALLATSIG